MRIIEHHKALWRESKLLYLFSLAMTPIALIIALSMCASFPFVFAYCRIRKWMFLQNFSSKMRADLRERDKGNRMDRKTKRLLIAGLVLIALFITGLASVVRAETTLSAVIISKGAGYDAGAGLDLEWLKRWNKFGFDLGGTALIQKKHEADSGYKWGLDGQARWYPLGDFYLGAGAAWAGYDSEFDDGNHWRKDAVWPVVGLGYDGPQIDTWLTYFIRESQTPNETEAIKIGTSALLGEHWVISGELAYVKFDQSGERENDLTGTLGVGWRW